MERQFRLRREWDALAKTMHMTALQFEAGWEELLAGLEEAGLAKTEREKFLAYIEKLGPHLGEEIRKDRRPRPDGAGGSSTREARTWEEAHAVVIELEGIKVIPGRHEEARVRVPQWRPARQNWLARCG